MICPHCRSGNCHRSHRRGLRDHVATFLGLRPWRCGICNTRYFAWSVPVAFVQYVHCSECGNLDLQRISSDHVDRVACPWLWPKLGAHAYRCAPCRRRFFSFRPYHRIVTLLEERQDFAKGPADTSA